MAIAFRGFAAASRQLGGDPPVDLSGIGIQNNDFMVGIGRVGGGQTLTKPDASWTTSPAQIATDAPFAWRRWNTGDATTWTWVASGASNAVVVIGVWSGVHTTSPVDDSDGITGTGALVMPSVDPAGLNRTLAQLVCKLANTTFTFSGGGELWDTPSSTQNFVTAGAQEQNIPNSATGTRTATPAGGGSTLGAAYMLALRPATTEYLETHTLTGDGVATRDVITITESKTLTGDGVATRALAEATTQNLVGDGVMSLARAVALARDLTGDGVPTRTVGVGETRDLTGDGVVDELHQYDAVRSFDLVGDGVLDGTKETVAAKTFDLVGDGVLDYIKASNLTKTFDIVGDGVITESRATNAARTFDLVGVGELVDNAICLPIDNIPSGGGPVDWSPNDGLKTISAVVYDHETGVPVGGATVCLVRDFDAFQVDCVISAGDGSYAFPRDTNDPYTYHTVVTSASGQGRSESGCVPV